MQNFDYYWIGANFIKLSSNRESSNIWSNIWSNRNWHKCWSNYWISGSAQYSRSCKMSQVIDLPCVFTIKLFVKLFVKCCLHKQIWSNIWRIIWWKVWGEFNGICANVAIFAMLFLIFKENNDYVCVKKTKG